jgi:hypothetical protein
MHYRLFVTIKQYKDETSLNARDKVNNQLQDEGFCNQDGRFSNGWADWFVIGGRWSGELTRSLLKKDYWEEVKKAVHDDNNFGYSTKDIEDPEKQKKFQEVWEKLGGYGDNPLKRDTYLHIGYEDDAMVVTKELYDKLLKKYEGQTEEQDQFIDLDYEECGEDFIGKKWLVVVDFHN